MEETMKILKLENVEDAKACANMMSKSEPWITLKRNFENSLRMLSDSSKKIYIVKNQDEKISGFIILILEGAFSGYIQTICVSPEARGKGIGSKLIEFAENRIFKDFPNVFICVSSFNERAKKLYCSLGYKVVGKLDDYIIKGYSEILLRKTIAPLDEFKKRQ